MTVFRIQWFFVQIFLLLYYSSIERIYEIRLQLLWISSLRKFPSNHRLFFNRLHKILIFRRGQNLSWWNKILVWSFCQENWLFVLLKKTKIQKKKIYGILFLGGTNLHVLQNLLTQHFHNSKWNSTRYKKNQQKKIAIQNMSSCYWVQSLSEFNWKNMGFCLTRLLLSNEYRHFLHSKKPKMWLLIAYK